MKTVPRPRLTPARLALTAFTAFAALGLAACGGGDGTQAQAAAETAAPPSVNPPPAAGPSQPGTADPSATPPSTPPRSLALGEQWLETGQHADWWTAAASGDGSLLVVAVNYGSLYASRDAGATWQALAAPGTGNWSSIDMDPTGTHIAATRFGGLVWLSHDGGQTWASSFHPCQFLGVTISNDGQHLAVVAKFGGVYTSDDAGASWDMRLPADDWQAIAGSEDGRILLTASHNGTLQVSSDQGRTWSAREQPRNWYRVAVSADGQRMAAADNGGYVYLSSDGGATWTPSFHPVPVTELSMTRDGRQLALSVPVENGETDKSGIFYSPDFGQTWQSLATPRVWRAAALSGDGNTLVAAAMADGSDPMLIMPGREGGHIYVTRAGVVTTASDSPR